MALIVIYDPVGLTEGLSIETIASQFKESS